MRRLAVLPLIAVFGWMACSRAVEAPKVLTLDDLTRPATAALGPFPAKSLRVSETAPDLSGLIDHRGAVLDPTELNGKVVVVTSVYACCPLACPVLLTEARLAVDAVPALLRKDLVVFAVTMDPEQDTPEKLAELAETFGAGPEWRFLTGSAARISAVLDAIGVERERNAETGEIDHNAVFLFVDRAGKLAYRLGMPGESNRHWHTGAMTALLSEKPPGS
ncbi:MAG: SCO family protein [Planctomycetota bacterium]|nr:SCO family protein [Planctomycetota bacterium]